MSNIIVKWDCDECGILIAKSVAASHKLHEATMQLVKNAGENEPQFQDLLVKVDGLQSECQALRMLLLNHYMEHLASEPEMLLN
jgi:hypothetical protein